MTEENQSSAVRKPNVKWRVVDIVVAAIVAVASGVIFWAWDFIYAVPTALFDSLTPGLGGLFHFMWLFAGPLVAIIIRKPGRGLLRRNHRRGHRNAAGQSIRRGARTADRHGPRTRRRNRLRGLRIPQVEPAHRDPGRRVDRPIQWPVRRMGRHRRLVDTCKASCSPSAASSPEPYSVERSCGSYKRRWRARPLRIRQGRRRGLNHATHNPTTNIENMPAVCRRIQEKRKS